LQELEYAVSRGSRESCLRALWHTTDLLIAGRYSEDEIWTFGEVGDILRGLAWRESTAPDIAGSPFNFALEHHRMITCYLRYEVDPEKLADFEAYGAMWLDLMPRFGGIHHGYFLPSEGESDVALAMFSFPSLAAYEQYRKDAGADPDVQKAVAFAKETRCFIRYERSFFRPLLPKTA
jgi:hypothetical protein